jgi:large subunit ribosomal protein L5
MSLLTEYRQNVSPSLAKKTGRKNPHALPQFTKITVNVGIGKYMTGEKTPATVIDGIAKITGQQPVVRNARMSISNFKLREGMPVGVTVTLRKQKMYDFLERLIKVVFPRIRDFRGFSPKAFDGRGNYSLGISDHLIFPEIPTDEIVKSFGVQITFSTTAENDEEARMLFDEFGFPFRKQ